MNTNMKRYSIAPSSTRRKSIVNPSIPIDDGPTARENATLELQQLEQSITSTLQDIDKNLSKSNAILNDKIFPIIRQYSKSTESVWGNVNYWKYFFESSANAELTSYQSPMNNAIKNNQKNILLSDDELYNTRRDTGTTTTTNPAGESDALRMARFKKPLLRGNIDDSTPTWSTDQPHKKMTASTPQGKPATRFGKFDLSESLNLNPPPMMATNFSSENKSPTRNQESVVYTMRKSLDQYHRLSISPRKKRHPKTPSRDNDFNRRSSMIKGFKDSSPTLPEPPVLVSEIGLNPSSESDQRQRDHKKVVDSPAADTHRFPRTPQFERENVRLSGGSARTSFVKTPGEIRREFDGDESDLRPPSITNIPELVPEPATGPPESDVVPLPELETIDLRRRMEDSNKKKRKLEQEEKVDEDSPFIEEKTGHNSIASTVYHSLITHQKENNSKDNTLKSNSVSNLFEDVLLDISKEHPEFNEDSKRSDNANSSGGMGSILYERFNEYVSK
ncbi:DASH complex subunit ask1 [Yamadazyma tenuis]|uniref:DASH complex subunit ask1 n=1 Tax=Candida tenuis TaxID=2315449 RepID=UPI0027A15AD7|nr:DASH complex subunit ask1 [Yamadazyma tenuis]